jgi:hypothetical protein
LHSKRQHETLLSQPSSARFTRNGKVNKGSEVEKGNEMKNGKNKDEKEAGRPLPSDIRRCLLLFELAFVAELEKYAR